MSNLVYTLLESAPMDRVAKVKTGKASIFLNDDYFPEIQGKKLENERSGFSPFISFSDEEMIYYYIHQPTHADERHNRTQETKKEYIRDLLYFYEQLQENASFLEKDILDFQEGSLLKNVQERHLQEYQQFLINAPRADGKKGYSLSTRSRKISVIKSFFIWLYQVNYITSPVHLGFLSNNVRAADRPNRALGHEEVQALLGFYQEHPINHALLSILATTGLRIRELADAKWANLYLDTHRNQYYLNVVTKGNKKRDVRIFANVFKRIQLFRKLRGFSYTLNPEDSSPLLPTTRGSFYDFKHLSNYVIKIIRETELPFTKHRQITPHYFRHYFALYAKQNGANLLDIQNQLDHVSARTTEIYLAEEFKKDNDVTLSWDENEF